MPSIVEIESRLSRPSRLNIAASVCGVICMAAVTVLALLWLDLDYYHNHSDYILHILLHKDSILAFQT